ncbi:hypothetical protein [Sicyoidochytrium minutum DNA virus]|nr:hypothetical protein [Sicyoidochytrium minutum DNA virus]
MRSFQNKNQHSEEQERTFQMSEHASDTPSLRELVQMQEALEGFGSWTPGDLPDIADEEFLIEDEDTMEANQGYVLNQAFFPDSKLHYHHEWHCSIHDTDDCQPPSHTMIREGCDPTYRYPVNDAWEVLPDCIIPASAVGHDFVKTFEKHALLVHPSKPNTFLLSMGSLFKMSLLVGYDSDFINRGRSHYQVHINDIIHNIFNIRGPGFTDTQFWLNIESRDHCKMQEQDDSSVSNSEQEEDDSAP